MHAAYVWTSRPHRTANSASPASLRSPSDSSAHHPGSKTEAAYHDIVPPPGIPRFSSAIDNFCAYSPGPDDPALSTAPCRGDGLALLARLSAAPLAVLGEMVVFRSVLFARSRRRPATSGNNLVSLIFARDRLNLKEFTAELAESRRTSTDQMLQRDDWQHGFWAAALARAKEWARMWPEGCRAAHCSMHRWGRSQCVRTGSRDREAWSRDAAHCPSLAHRQG